MENEGGRGWGCSNGQGPWGSGVSQGGVSFYRGAGLRRCPPPGLHVSICGKQDVLAQLWPLLCSEILRLSPESLCPFSQGHSGMSGVPSEGPEWVGAVASEGSSF